MDWTKQAGSAAGNYHHFMVPAWVLDVACAKGAPDGAPEIESYVSDGRLTVPMFTSIGSGRKPA